MIVRRLQVRDLDQSSRLHQDVLRAEFLARCGIRFLRRYHRAWIETADGIALAAVDEGDRVVGVLLGSTVPHRHYRMMLRRHGVPLAALLVLQAVKNPTFGRELLVTRMVRYARGVIRMLLSVVWELRKRTSARDRVLDVPTRSSGEITHVMVKEEMAGTGIGRSLLEQARVVAEQAHLEELVLVTMPDLPSLSFYEHLGWRRTGERSSRSGESFIEFRLGLSAVSRPPMR